MEKAFFALKKGAAYIGIFSSAENTKDIAFDTIEEITPCFLEGSPAFAGYVCLAEGTWSFLTRNGDAFQTEYHDVGPVWGINMQSAVGGLFGHSFHRKTIQLSVLRIYQVDHDYSEGSPENLSDRFHFLAHRLTNDRAFSHDVLTADYIAQYFEEKRRAAQTAEIRESKYKQLVLDKLLSMKFENQNIRCARPVVHAEKKLDTILSRLFTLKELQIIAVLWGLEKDEELSDQIISGKISADYICELLKKIQKQTDVFPTRSRPPVRSRLADYVD